MALDTSTAVLSRHEELELQSNSAQSDSKVVIFFVEEKVKAEAKTTNRKIVFCKRELCENNI